MTGLAIVRGDHDTSYLRTFLDTTIPRLLTVVGYYQTYQLGRGFKPKPERGPSWNIRKTCST